MILSQNMIIGTNSVKSLIVKDKIILTKSIDRIISLNETGVAYKNSELNLFDRSGTKTINNKDKVDTRLIPGEDQIKYIGFTLSKIKDNGIEKNK